MHDRTPPNGSDPDAPPWFENDVEADEPREEPGLRQKVVVAAAMVVILVLVLIPILQAVILERRQENLPDDEFQRTALQFASAVFFARSTGQALLFASEEAAGDIEDVISYFRDQPPNSSQARVQIAVSPCPRDWDAARICYTGRLVDPGSLLSPAIEFGLAEEDDEPLVQFVQLERTTARTPASRW